MFELICATSWKSYKRIDKCLYLVWRNARPFVRVSWLWWMGSSSASEASSIWRVGLVKGTPLWWFLAKCSLVKWMVSFCSWLITQIVADYLTLSWRGPLSYRNQSIDLLRKSMDWFLYDNGLCHERVLNIPPLMIFLCLISFLPRV